MNARQLILLSPYRLPTQSTLYLGDDEVAAFLNGYAALWHPAALALALPPVTAPPPPTEGPAAPDLFDQPAGEAKDEEEEAPPPPEEEMGAELGPDHEGASYGAGYGEPAGELSAFARLPIIASPYDHEQPQPDHIYAVPDA